MIVLAVRASSVFPVWPAFPQLPQLQPLRRDPIAIKEGKLGRLHKAGEASPIFVANYSICRTLIKSARER